LPPGLEARDRRRRERRTVTEQSAQGEIEVALGQPVQVEFGEQPADFLRASLERRQQLALEALTQAAYPRTPERDRPVAEAQPARFAEAVAVADRGIDRRAPLLPVAGEQPVHFLFQHPLQELLHTVSSERLQRLPRRA
jgi:hypothetical protein